MILVKDSMWGPTGLCLKLWDPGFEPRREANNIRKFWFLMPMLPLETWHSKILEKVGNVIGHFITFVEGWLENFDTMLDRILVELDLREVLLVDLDIERRDCACK